MLAVVLCLSVCAFTGGGKKRKNKKNCHPPKKFIDPANMDLSVKPGDNFFEYANGTWIKNHPIPAKETRWGSFGILNQENTDRLLGLLNEVSKTTHPAGSLEQRVGDLYARGMDSLTIDKRGFDPIKPDLERIDKIDDLNGVINEAVFERTHGEGDPLFRFGVGQDSKYPTKNIANLNQGGTSLPDRDNYLKANARNQKIQEAYKQYIISLFTLTGTDNGAAAKNAATIFDIETALAKAQLSRVAMRDPNVTYNKFSVADFSKTTPHLNWVELMPEMKVPGQDTLLVGQPAF